jgi:ABC-type antimicrobial peptide transport system permease subunit
LSRFERAYPRFSMTLFSIFALVALLLAATGLYSVVSYTVAQRTNEFGIRMALGAEPQNILRIVFASVAGSLGAGIAAGLALVFTLNRILAKWTISDSREPVILLLGIVLLAAVAVIACAVPARRAACIDPMTALHKN